MGLAAYQPQADDVYCQMPDVDMRNRVEQMVYNVSIKCKAVLRKKEIRPYQSYTDNQFYPPA